jgi:hypothetical protein
MIIELSQKRPQPVEKQAASLSTGDAIVASGVSSRVVYRTSRGTRDTPTEMLCWFLPKRYQAITKMSTSKTKAARYGRMPVGGPVAGSRYDIASLS